LSLFESLCQEATYDYIGEFRYLPGPRGLPLLKPPFASLVAIDMNTGEHRWRIPIGRGPVNHTAISLASDWAGSRAAGR